METIINLNEQAKKTLNEQIELIKDMPLESEVYKNNIELIN
jgi:hypothetical protein